MATIPGRRPRIRNCHLGGTGLLLILVGFYGQLVRKIGSPFIDLYSVYENMNSGIAYLCALAHANTASPGKSPNRSALLKSDRNRVKNR